MNKTTDPARPEVAVIILNWNGSGLLRRYLPSVVANTTESYARVIVADNGSDDDSLQVLAADFPEVEVIRLDRNYGYAGGYNRAVAMAGAPLAVLLNSDVEPAPGWLGPLYRYMCDNPGAGACQPKILSLVNRDTFEYAGACGGFIDRNGYPYCRGRIFDSCEKDSGQYDTVMPVFWATGAAMMVRSDVYNVVGGLDEDFFAHMEEIDMCWRIRLAGYAIAAVPQSVVYHLGGGSLPAANPRKTYLNFRNNLLMLHKNLPDSTRRATLLRRRLLDAVAWARFVAGGRWGNASAVWRAHRDFRRMRGKYTTHPATDLLRTDSGARRNILVDYYLRGRRRFSDLH